MDKTAEPQASDWDEDMSDAPMDDPGAAVRFAGCSVENELRLLEASTK